MKKKISNLFRKKKKKSDQLVVSNFNSSQPISNQNTVIEEFKNLNWKELECKNHKELPKSVLGKRRFHVSIVYNDR